MNEKAYMKEEWFALLKAEIGRTSMRAVAEKLGYSATTVSLIVNGKYAGKTDTAAKRVMAALSVVGCPFTETVIPRSACIEIALSAAPTHNPIKIQQWKSCVNCPKRPEK